MNDILKSLKTAISNVMERMFFFLPDPEEEGDCRPVDGTAVSIGVSGTPGYRVTLTFDPVLAQGMVVNALGVEKPDKAIVEKCLLEAANIIAGNFLHNWQDAKGRELTLPSFNPNDIHKGAKSSESQTVTLWFDFRGVSATIETIPGS